LHNLHDAEDAFQATFLVLANKAGSIRRREAVGSWLHRVAYRLAVDAQADAARRKSFAKRAAALPSPDPVLDLTVRELRRVLNEELRRLPEEYRAPLVLCCLEEKTLEEAARLLGWTRGAVRGRLQRGRERLRARLRRRGLELPAGLSATALALSSASGRVSARLADSTLRAALKMAAGRGASAGVVSAEVAALVQGASQTMFTSKAKTATALVLAVSVAAGAFGVVRHRARAADQLAPQQGQAEKPKAGENQQPRGAQPKPEAEGTVEVRGRVLGPDGRPVAGAKLYLNYRSPKPLDYPVRATSGEDGRFEFTFARSELDPTYSDSPVSQVVAVAMGYGFDFAQVGGPGAGRELTLRLVKDIPVVGRILDSDGKPVAGAKVRVAGVRVYKGEDLQEELDDVRRGGWGTSPAKFWAGPLPGQPASVTTAGDGKFRLTGLGRERIADLVVEGPAIQQKGPLTVKLQPLGSASGRVVDKDGQPRAGLVLSVNRSLLLDGVQVKTDKDGRFRAEGLVPGQKYDLWEANRVRPGGVRDILVEPGKNKDLGDIKARDD
jgi:RNA polymerase sigma factor (sigma-70 family)